MKQVTHVYFVPGMAADVSIFEFIELPEDRYEMHTIRWKIPKKNESMQNYALRMCEEIEHKECVLIGVSFGGIMVQAMSKYLKVKKLIIISSVKNKHELPKRMRFVRKTKAYKLMPTSLVSKINNWEKLAFGDFAKKRAAMYQKYLSVNDKTYLNWAIEQIVCYWAIEQIVCWDQEESIKGIVHIHGDSDIVFPVAYINDCIRVEKGTHVMIVNRARWFNTHLPEIIEN